MALTWPSKVNRTATVVAVGIAVISYMKQRNLSRFAVLSTQGIV